MNTVRTKTKQNPAVKADRQRRAYELSLLGNSVRKVSEIMTQEGYRNVGKDTVATLIKEGCAAVVHPALEEWRNRELDRCDYWLAKLNNQLEDPRFANIYHLIVEKAVRVSDRAGKLLGADKPIEANVQVTEVTQVDLALQELISEVQAKNSVEDTLESSTVNP